MHQLKRSVNLLDTVKISPSISQDQKAATIIFSDLEVSIENMPKGDRIATQIASIEIPLDSSPDVSQLNQIIRGDVDVDPGASGLYIVQSLNQTHVFKFSDGVENGSFTNCFTSSLESETQYYRATIFLLVEKYTANEDIGARLTLDSLDLELKNVKANS